MRGEPPSPPPLLALATARDPGNATAWQEYADAGFVVANALVLLLTSVVGLASNVFVILAVYHQKSLQTSNNALVVNLAVVDILRCAVDCPVLLAIVVLVHRRGHAAQAVCDAQVAFFSLSSCVQMLTLACISAERYQAIAQPFKTTQRRRRITALIPLTWALAAAVAACCLLFLKDSPVHVRCKGWRRDASQSYDTFGLYVLLPLWAACFSVITGFYASIFGLVRSHNRKIFDKGTFPFSKKDKKKTEEVTVVENGKPDKGQTPPPAEPATKAEEGASKKASAAAPTPLKTAAERKREASAALEVERPERARPEERALKMEQSNPGGTGAEPSNKGVAGSARSSAPPQKVSGKINTAIQTAEKVKSDTAAGEAAGTSPRPPPSRPPPAAAAAAAASEDPESASVLLIKPKQAQNSGGGGGGGPPPAVKEDQPPPSLAPVLGEAAPLNQVAPPTQAVPTKAPTTRSEPPTQVTSTETSPTETAPTETTPADTAPTETAPTETTPAETAPTEAPKDDLEVDGAVCMMPPRASKERANKKKESKMAKRAGYIIVTFLLFWLPLITTILLNFVIHKNKSTQVSTVQQVEVLSVSVSCITSLSDPIIYAAVNPQFRSEFNRIRNKVKSAFTFDWQKTE